MGLWNNPYRNGVVMHPLYNPNQPRGPFFHGSFFQNFWQILIQNRLDPGSQILSFLPHLSHLWLVVEPTHLKNMSQTGNLPQFSGWK